MAYEPKYIPYRIMKAFEVAGSLARLNKNCRGASKIVRRGKLHYAIYRVLTVVNVPTEFEMSFFSKTKRAVPIPQDKFGIDLRISGVARSVRTSRDARQRAIFEIVAIRDEITAAQKVVMPPKPAVKPSVPCPVEKKDKSIPDNKSKSFSSRMKATQAETGIGEDDAINPEPEPEKVEKEDHPRSKRRKNDSDTSSDDSVRRKP